MKQFLKKIAVTTGLFLPVLSYAHYEPLISLGDCTHVFLRGLAEGHYESNVFRDSKNEKDDFYFILVPGVDVVFGHGDDSHFNGKVTFLEQFFIYNDQSKLDRQEAYFFAQGSQTCCRLTTNAYASFEQKAENTPDINVPSQLVKRYLATAGVDFIYDFSPRTSLEVALHFDYTDFRDNKPGFKDHYIYAVPLACYYEFSPKLEIGPSYRFTYVNLKNCPDFPEFYDHFGGIAFRGQFCSKLVVDFHLGVLHRTVRGEASCTTFGAIAAAQWEMTPCVMVKAAAYRDNGTGGFGSSLINTGARLDLEYKINHCWHVAAMGSYNRSSYEVATGVSIGRKDNTWSTDASIAYIPWGWLTLSGGYVYVNNDSNVSGNDFNNHSGYVKALIRI